MAKRIRCKVKFGKFKWNRAGYAEAMNAPAVQSMVAKPARAIESACNASFTPDPGEGQGYVAKQVSGKLAKGYVVRTATPHAHNSERKYNRLLGALGSQGGS